MSYPSTGPNGMPTPPSSVPSTNQGSPISVGGVVYGWSDALGRYVAQKSSRLRNPPLPKIGRLAGLGSSTMANSETTINGMDFDSYRSTLAEANYLLGSRYDIEIFGYAGQANSTILTHLAEVYAWGPDIINLQLAANDLSANTEAAAETAFATLQTTALDAISRGICVIIQTPHYNGSNWRAALHYDTLCQEWGAYMGIPVISGIYTVASGADKTGTAKASTMADSLHVNDLGARYYGVEGYAVLESGIVRRIGPGGSAQVASELFANPRMTGSVAASGTGFSGTAPSDWTFARAGGASTTVVSKGSDADGDYMDLTVTSTASDDYITIQDASFTTALSGKPAFKFRQIVDYEIITPGACENVRGFIPLTSGTIQTPNGNSANFSGVLAAGRRKLVSGIIDTALTGVAMAANTAGVRISFSGAGTSVIRIRGISARESRW